MKGAETRLARIGLVALGYFMIAKLGLLLATVSGNTTPLWPTSGLSLALLLILGPEVWPGVWLGATLAAVSSGVPLPAAATIGIGFALEVVIAAYLLRRTCGSAGPFLAAKNVFVFGVVSSLGSAFAASVGTSALGLIHLVPAGMAAQNWCLWWLGDWTSILILTPPVLAWQTVLRGRPSGRSLRGDLLLVAAAIPLGLLLFFNGPPAPARDIAPYLLFPLLVCATIYLDRRKALTSVVILSVAAITGTQRGLGPFHGPDRNRSLIELQAFIAILSFTGLAVSSFVAERRRAEASLRLSRNELELRLDRRTAALRESEEAFAKAFNSSPLGLAISTAEEGHYLAVNDAFLRPLGFTRDEVVGRASWEVGIFPSLHAREQMRDRLLLNGSVSEIELVVRAKSGEERDCRLSAEIIKVGGVRRFLCSLRDVTETRRAEKLIAHLAHHDSLTGLPNRLLFQDRFDLAIMRARRQGHMLGILLLDIDRFKVVNDNLGHAAGDRFLRRVAERLVRSVRACDTVVRLGGDEFVILLGEIRLVEDVGRVARKILDNLSRPYELDQREIFTTASIGASVYPVDGTDGEALLRHAGTAMSRAKSLGGDVFRIFTPAMSRRTAERLGTEAELHRALRGGELVVYYQPQLTLASNRIECVEALVRWRHPTRGLLLPRSFMRIAEQTGLVVLIDMFVFRQACLDLVAWKRAGLPPVKIAVNVSLRQLQQADLASRIREILAETGADPGLLDLEINEKVAIGSIRSHRSTITEVREMGLCFSLDDFGHGHSSLSHLRELPIETVKIDRSFVRKTTRDPRDAAIARTLISMAHTLRMRVVAEGVDSLPLLSFLRDEECDAIQGFYFSRPVPAPMLEELLTIWEGESGRLHAVRVA
jgi:diguanylate cyclase (GGDEF)-like protein/PAS domain S-box-containing protein